MGVNSTSLLTLILNANVAVQLIMLGLLIASIVSWAYIFQYIILLKKTKQEDASFYKKFWSIKNISQLYQEYNNKKNEHCGLARVFISGFNEYLKFLDHSSGSEKMMENVQRVMKITLAKEQEHLDQHLIYLATLGSIAPYIGLLGTVIGVMNSFRGLSVVHQTTLMAVAPGIAEALVATAMGLATAIPAVLAYNRFNGRISFFLTKYQIFCEEFSTILHRKIYYSNNTASLEKDK